MSGLVVRSRLRTGFGAHQVPVGVIAVFAIMGIACRRGMWLHTIPPAGGLRMQR